MLVICGGSPLLCAQADRWTQQQGPGSRPVLRVALNTPGERPLALAALKFIYTDKLDVRGAKQLLGVRRLAGYLQVEGCVEACDAALTALITASTAQPLRGVADLFQHRHLLPDGDADRAAVQRVLHACRKQLVRHAGDVIPGDRVTISGPDWGEVLAWAFLDAPSLLSDRGVLKQHCALPADALWALLWSDSFATDDEATVLLVLAHWVQANPTTSQAVRDWLCKPIRLCQLSATYLHIVLSEIHWFSIDPAEYRFICAYSRAKPAKRKSMKKAQGTDYYFITSQWYNSERRRPESGKRAVTSFMWHVTEQDLAAGLLLTTSPAVFLYGTFSDGAQAVVSHGFEWRVSVDFKKGKDTAGVFLRCRLPAALQVAYPASVVDMVCPGPVSLVAYKWRTDESREEAFKGSLASSFIQISQGCGYSDALKLKPVAEQRKGSGRLLAEWAPFLKGGRIYGALEWR